MFQKQVFQFTLTPLTIMLSCLLIVVSPQTHSGTALYKYKDKPITLENWRTNPEILKIRKIFSEIASLQKAGKLKVSSVVIDTKANEECWRPGSFESEEMAQDAQGRVRIFRSASFMSHGSVVRTSYYYDPEGRIRFGLVEYAHVPGGEYAPDIGRIYYSTDGKVFFYIAYENDSYFVEKMKNTWFLAAGPKNAKRALKVFKINMATPTCPVKKNN